jgi:hypothetical protein
MNTDTAGREGFALLAVIAVLAVTELLLLGLWRVAAGSVAAAHESAAQARTRIEAESALRQAIADWDESAAGGQPAGTWYLVPGSVTAVGSVQVAVEALSGNRGTRLLRSTATDVSNGSIRARATAEAILSAVPVDEFWSDFHSAIVSGGDVAIAAGDTIDGTNAGPPLPWTAAECPPLALPGGARAGLAMASGAAVTGTGAALAGSPPMLSGATRATPPDFDRIGGVDAVDFHVIADRFEAGSITLSSASAGTVCDTSRRGNWGEPSIPGHPCHDYFPIIYSATDLNIGSGAGQGILIVNGNLTIAAGVRFYGAVLVRGRLDAAGAELLGSVRIAGTSGASRLGGAFRYEDCALDRAFRLAPGLRRLYRISDRWWLPTF